MASKFNVMILSLGVFNHFSVANPNHNNSAFFILPNVYYWMDSLEIIMPATVKLDQNLEVWYPNVWEVI